MTKYATATAAQMDSIRINLHHAIRNLKRRGAKTWDEREDNKASLIRFEADLEDLENEYTRRFLS